VHPEITPTSNFHQIRDTTEGAFDATVPTEWIVEAYENLTYAAWSLVRSGEATPKQAAELAWRTLSRGLKGNTQ
ncbi:MAG: hypothetical protein OXC60_05955, partial [Litoreibacter sp.]|nr:hypothetical protein [Litoreibacter sp.]